MLFFSQANPALRPRHIVLGQYLGFAGLVGVSLLGFVGSLVIPQSWIGLLGFLPIIIGLRRLLRWRSVEHLENTAPPIDAHPPARLASLLNPQIYYVAAVTVANGGDNIGIYTPLFANSSLTQLGLILLVFFVLVAGWCYLGWRLSRHPLVAGTLTRYGHVIVPVVLIGLGLYILLESETLTLVGLG